MEEIRVEGDLRNVVHRNTVLIRADSPDEAFEKAVRLGQQAEVSYENTSGKLVHITFKGLGSLNVVHDELSDGAELQFEEFIGLDSRQLQQLVRPKEQLSVFRATMPTTGPDYSCKEVLDASERLVDEKE